MGARAYDFRRQLTGRTLVTNPVPTGNDAASRLFRRIGSVSSQKSIIVYLDGTVEEGVEFDIGKTQDPSVHTFILGGTDFRCEPSGWLHDTLIAAGYNCQFSVEDIYTDTYTDEYPVEDGT